MNTSSFVTSLRIAGWLLWCDIRLFLKDWQNNVLNSLFWPVVLILANGKILPAMGMPDDYGSFITISMLVIMASFSAWSDANVLAADFAGALSIGYELTLPVYYWMVYLKIILSLALKAALFSLISLVVGKIILMNLFSFAAFNFYKFVLVYAMACFFFGTFAVWAAALAGSVDKFMNLELRLAGPLFFICGYSFSWQILDRISPIMGKLMLATPWIYAYEGIRSAILGPNDYLNLWISFLMLCLFSAAFIFYGLYLFKRRLDCV
jgi:ABC-2 type transport system permease protein